MDVKLERLEVSLRVALDPLSPPGLLSLSKRNAKPLSPLSPLSKVLAVLAPVLIVLVPLVATPSAAHAEEPSALSSILRTARTAGGLLPEASEKSDKQDKKDDESSFELGAEYLLALRAATSVWTGPVEQALSFLGTPYRLGGTSRKGIDCSGLIGLVFRHEGFSVPRTAAEQFRIGSPVELGELRAGDLVFFANTYKRGISHVGLFIGDGKFIHAENRRRGVVITSLNNTYYRSRFAGGRRLLRTPGDDLMAAADRRSPKTAIDVETLREEVAVR